MKKRFDLRTIRTQLPLSYAGIAILATMLIGAVMVFILGNYYHTMEVENLNTNAAGIAQNLTRASTFYATNTTSVVQDLQGYYRDQARTMSFLVQARVQIIDTAGNSLADSGAPNKDWNLSIPNDQSSSQNGVKPTSVSTDQSPLLVSSSGSSIVSSDPPNDGHSISFHARPNLFGFLIQDTSFVDGNRFDYTSKASFTDSTGAILGYVLVSESPNYGQSILQNVIRGWLIASLVTVLVSVLLGWWMSWHITHPIEALEKVALEMKDGNYAIRSEVSRPEELASLSGTINQMAVQIQSNITTLREFVSDAAHEIRTPLTALRADLNLALNDKDNERTRELVNRSLEQVNRLELLSKDLLDLSKIESQMDDKVSNQPIELREFLLKTSEIHASVAEQAGVGFEVHLPENKLWVEGSESRLHRAISNLLENAVKFTPVGGQINVTLKSETPWAVIQVEDNGIGIPTEERTYLFNRFHRGRNAANYAGSGLGLAIAKVIVEKHHGEIGLLPDENKTCFFIKLPLLPVATPDLLTET